MSKLSDFDIWREYTKTVSKIENANKVSRYVMVKAINQNNPKLAFKRKFDNETDFILNRISPGSFQVNLLNKGERRKFRAEATIDLHGHTRKIDSTLEIFCAKCIVSSLKNIVIISGKGEGIVRDAVLNWMQNNPNFVVGYFEIKDMFGGSGSFGVRLRGK